MFIVKHRITEPVVIVKMNLTNNVKNFIRKTKRWEQIAPTVWVYSAARG